MKKIAISLTLFILLAASTPVGREYTRGVGVYPGNPSEDFPPTLVQADSNYRNLAYLRPAYHSSSYDYNLTAQLVTDGIRETTTPRGPATTLSRTGVRRGDGRSGRE